MWKMLEKSDEALSAIICEECQKCSKKSDEHEVAVDGRNIFLRKKFIKLQVRYHVIFMKKVILSKKDIQNT